MKFEGGYKFVEEVAEGEQIRVFENDFPQYYWPERRFLTEKSSHSVALMKDVFCVGIWNLYSQPESAFLRNTSYPGSLSHFKIPHTIKHDGPIQNAHLSIDAEINRVIEEPVFIIGGHNNHYHWLLNWLPRLDIYRRCLASGWNSDFFQNCKFAVHNDISKAHLDSLSLLGIDSSKIIFIKTREVVHFKNVAVSSFFSSYIYDSRALRFLNTEFRRTPIKDDVKPKRKIWIYREGISEPRRRVRNYSQLTEILAKYQIEIVKLEDLSFTEQVECFTESELVISAHGAGLSNCVFCRPGTDIILFEYKEFSEYEELAKQCGLNVTTYRCEQHIDSEYENGRPSFDPRFRDLIVPTDDLDQKIAWIIKRRNIDSDVLQINNLTALRRAAEKSQK